MLKKTKFTKQDLIDWGFTIETVGDGRYAIYRTWIRSGFHKKPEKRRMNIYDIRTSHIYGDDRYYPVVVFSHNGKAKSIPLSRLVYTWYLMPEGIDAELDVDHIDDNPYNNRLDNLQLLTHSLNIAKRGYGRNQYNFRWSVDDILTLREMEQEREHLFNECLEIKKQMKEHQKAWRTAKNEEDAVKAKEEKKMVAELRKEYNMTMDKKREVKDKIDEFKLSKLKDLREFLKGVK